MASSYHQFCPIARAADILCQRWTLLILRDLHSGCTRFNELKRGVPRISPTLLSQRLKMLERDGLIRREQGEDGSTLYKLTRSGRETAPLLLSLGVWGQRWLQDKLERGDIDEGFLIYAIQVSLDPAPLGPSAVVQITFNDRPKLKWDRWWLLVDEDTVDSCYDDPGKPVNVFIEGDLVTLTQIWRGASLREAIEQGLVLVDGDRRLAGTIDTWFRGSLFSTVELPPNRLDMPATLQKLSTVR